MFDQLKQMMEVKKMQSTLQRMSMTVERQGVSVTMRGDFEITDLQLSSTLDAATQRTILLSLLGEARTRLQKDMAQAFSGLMK